MVVFGILDNTSGKVNAINIVFIVCFKSAILKSIEFLHNLEPKVDKFLISIRIFLGE